MNKRAPAEAKEISRLSLARAGFGAAQDLRYHWTDYRQDWDTTPKDIKEAYLAVVDAILAELREPTPEMCSASGMGAGPTAKLTATAIWQAMIDAIGDET